LPPDSEATIVADSVLKLSALTLRNVRKYSAGGDEETSTQVTLGLADRTVGLIETPLPAPCCGAMACFIITGQSAAKCRSPQSATCGSAQCDGERERCVSGECKPCLPTPLDISAASISGVQGGTVNLDMAGDGRWAAAGIAPPLFAADNVDVSVQGKGGDASFPDYTQKVTAPDPLTILSPEPGPATTIGNRDLPVRWEPGNGDLVEVTVRAANAGTGDASNDRIVCQDIDDGCLSIPVGAFETIRQDLDPDSSLLLTVSRITSTTTVLETSALAQVKASQRVDLLLTP